MVLRERVWRIGGAELAVGKAEVAHALLALGGNVVEVLLTCRALGDAQQSLRRADHDQGALLCSRL